MNNNEFQCLQEISRELKLLREELGAMRSNFELYYRFLDTDNKNDKQ